MDVPFSVSLERGEDDLAVLRLAGEVDVHTAQQLRDCLREAVRIRPPRVVVDLTDTLFFDSSGLGVLVEGFKLAAAGGGTLTVRNAPVQITGLAAVFGLPTVRGE